MLTVERLREILIYDPKTGAFRWLVGHGRMPAGSIAGATLRGYIRIHIDGQSYFAHRLAWLYVYGEWPPGRLDHWDTVRSHNWIDNLRVATSSQNQANTRCRSRNRSGFKGVNYHKRARRYRAEIRVNQQAIYLGLHDTPEAAHAAYCAAALKYFGEFARSE